MWRQIANGLSGGEAARRLQVFGPNRLRPPTPVSALRVLSDQFKSIVVYLLVAAVVVSALLGDWAEAAAVAVVLLINTVLGFTMELRARRTMDALLKMNVLRASVLRDGQLMTVDAAVLVKGDIVELTAGHHVPADSRLIHATDFRTNEAALTGESELISKAAAVGTPADTALAERINMIYKGTTVASGVARAVVVATGVETELGRIGGLVAEISGGADAARTATGRVGPTSRVAGARDCRGRCRIECVAGIAMVAGVSDGDCAGGGRGTRGATGGRDYCASGRAQAHGSPPRPGSAAAGG